MKFRIEPTSHRVGQYSLLVWDTDIDLWRLLEEGSDVYLLEQAAAKYKDNVERLERWKSTKVKEFEL